MQVLCISKEAQDKVRHYQRCIIGNNACLAGSALPRGEERTGLLFNYHSCKYLEQYTLFPLDISSVCPLNLLNCFIGL